MKKTTRQIRRETQIRQGRLRTAIFGVIVITVLSLAGYYLESTFFRPALEPMAGNVIDVETSMSGFDQKQIHVKAGNP